MATSFSGNDPDPRPDPTLIGLARRQVLAMTGLVPLGLAGGVGATRALAGPRDEWAVRIEAPELADVNFRVPVRVMVDGPMTEDHHVQILDLFLETPLSAPVARFRLTPALGPVDISTRIRLAFPPCTDSAVYLLVGRARYNDGRLVIGRRAIRIARSANSLEEACRE